MDRRANPEGDSTSLRPPEAWSEVIWSKTHASPSCQSSLFSEADFCMKMTSDQKNKTTFNVKKI